MKSDKDSQAFSLQTDPFQTVLWQAVQWKTLDLQHSFWNHEFSVLPGISETWWSEQLFHIRNHILCIRHTHIAGIFLSDSFIHPANIFCLAFTKWELPWWLSGKGSAYQCKRYRRHGFDPWVRKIPWRRKWQPTLVFLPGKSHRQRSLEGYSPWDHRELTWLSNWACTHSSDIELSARNQKIKPGNELTLTEPSMCFLRIWPG